MRFAPIAARCLFLAGLGVVSIGHSQETPGSIKIMKEELSRNFDGLQKEQVPPYYLSYSVDEVRTQSVTGSFGAITFENDNKVSYLRIDMRVGSYHLDNSHELRGDSLSRVRDRLASSVRAPLSESPDALRVILWRETDRSYKNAVETFSRVKSEKSVKERGGGSDLEAVSGAAWNTEVQSGPQDPGGEFVLRQQ